MRSAPPQFAIMPVSGRLIEGWLFSPQAQQYNAEKKHRALDFVPLAAGESIDVRAVAAGYASYSYDFHREHVTGPYGESDGFGRGNVVFIYHPSLQLVTLSGHLDLVEDCIPYTPPVVREDNLVPPQFEMQGDQLRYNTCFVKQGQVIGTMGNSGLRGSQEFRHTRARELPSFDPKHLHFECALLGSHPWLRLDPCDLRKSVEAYMTADGMFILGPNHIWLLDENGQPRLI